MKKLYDISMPRGASLSADRKRVRKYFSLLRLRRQDEWLSSMAAEGWQLVDHYVFSSFLKKVSLAIGSISPPYFPD